MSAAKTKAQGIIDDNAVGMLKSFALYLSSANRTCSSRLQQVILPILQGHQDSIERHGREILRHRIGSSRYVNV